MKITTETKLTKTITRLIKVLNIENAEEIIVKTEDLPERNNGYMFQDPDNKNVYTVVLNSNLSKNVNFKTLAHEMIHVAQYDRGDLVTKIENREAVMGPTVREFWKGKEICLQTTSYMELPWEKEAFADMKRVAQAARK